MEKVFKTKGNSFQGCCLSGITNFICFLTEKENNRKDCSDAAIISLPIVELMNTALLPREAAIRKHQLNFCPEAGRKLFSRFKIES